MLTDYYATRSTIDHLLVDTSQIERLGPFPTRAKARQVLALHLSANLAFGIGEHATAAQKIAVPECQGILTEMAAYGDADVFEANGVRWVIRATS